MTRSFINRHTYESIPLTVGSLKKRVAYSEDIKISVTKRAERIKMLTSYSKVIFSLQLTSVSSIPSVVVGGRKTPVPPISFVYKILVRDSCPELLRRAI